MSLPFIDRTDAGLQLATRLERLRGRADVLVLGLPRGGIPVAAVIARSIGAPLDSLAVRKLGVPGHEELAMGAVASGGVRVLNHDVIRALRIPDAAVEAATRREMAELQRRESAYRDHRPVAELSGKTVMLVDDGIATGSTMLAALRGARARGARSVIVAAPVMSAEAQAAMTRSADGCETVATPEPFGGVGAWYMDFTQTSDREVRDLLNQQGGDIEAGAGHGPKR